MGTSTATGWTTPTGTPSLDVNRVVFTTGSSITIDAPADVVFNIIIAFQKYHEWNSWTPFLTFSTGDVVEPGSCGILQAKTEGQSQDFKIPVEILEVKHGENEYKLPWKSKYLPAWAATLERVQVVTPKGKNACEVRNWESMGGIAAYGMKFGTQIPKQIEEANVKYLNELADYVRRGKA